jgi:hypothetical protein
MSIASTIPVVVAGLLDLFNAATWPTSAEWPEAPEVADSDPENEKRQLVVVGDTFAEGDDDQQWAALGARTKSERYAVRIHVKILGPGLDVSEARTRAFALLAVIEETLIENVTLAIPSTANYQIISVALRQPTHRQGILDEGRGCVIETAVQVAARLTR